MKQENRFSLRRLPRVLCGALGLVFGQISISAAESQGYLFATFRDRPDNSGEQLYLGLSRDGYSWTALNDGRPCLVNDLGAGGVRDPFILRAHDNKAFYLIATDLSITLLRGDWGKAVRQGSRSIVIWESKNLLDWSGPRIVPVAPSDAGCTWAPEAVYDPETGDYLVYWASTTGRDRFSKHRIWACRTRDFVTFGEPFVYMDNSAATIDTTIVREGDSYYRFTKDETVKAITMERAAHLAGPWNPVPGFNLDKIPGCEGPACFVLEPASGDKPATWCLLLDHYAKVLGYKAYITRDLASGIFEPAPDVTFSFKFRHGSVLPLTEEEYQRVATSPRPPALAAAGTQDSSSVSPR